MSEHEECVLHNFDVEPSKDKKPLNNKMMKDLSWTLLKNIGFNNREQNQIPNTIGVAKDHLLISRDQFIYYIKLQDIFSKKIT